MEDKKIIHNKCQCAKCKEVIESVHRHDFVYCKCNAIFTDGGTAYIRRGGAMEDIIPLDEYEETDDTKTDP